MILNKFEIEDLITYLKVAEKSKNINDADKLKIFLLIKKLKIESVHNSK